MTAVRTGSIPKSIDTPEHRALGHQMQHHADHGRLPACLNNPHAVSEDREERALLAATLCPGCVLLDACAAAGEHERFGVWGGVDRTPTKPSPVKAKENRR